VGLFRVAIRVAGCVAAMIALVAAAACGLEGPAINAAMRDRSAELPKAADTVVTGTVPGAPTGTEVRVYAAAGARVDGVGGAVGDGGAFELRFPGNTEFSGLRIDARWSGGQACGIVPFVPKRGRVDEPEAWVAIEDAMPGMGALSLRATTFALVVEGRLLSDGKSLASVPPSAMRKMALLLGTLLDQGNAALATFQSMVADLAAIGGKDGKWPFSGDLPEGAIVKDLADRDLLASAGITPDQFEAALLAAAAELQVEVCYATDRIRAVLLADLRPGAKDRNCQAIDPYKFADKGEDKTVWLAAGIHKTTPVCGTEFQPPHCITQETLDATNEALANWVPNKNRMYDDGTHGDAVKGDLVFTLAMDLPYVPVAGSPTGAGVRLGYKYTYGSGGQGWTGSEEWPGNQRLLELVDVNGDGIVVRMDAFGDETSNKDKSNLLTPANGGCGLNLWENEVKPKCAHDTREGEVDTDGDCKPDAWPPAGSVSPLTVDCPS
jgi:hypothetical protein